MFTDEGGKIGPLVVVVTEEGRVSYKESHEKAKLGMKVIIYKNSLSMTPCHVTSSKCTSGGGHGIG